MKPSLELIRVRGQVQGVGFRPTVARLATQLGLPGWVKNDQDGVLIALAGEAAVRERFVHALLAQLPPLARVQELVRESAEPAAALLSLPSSGFAIVDSTTASEFAPRAQLVPDAALCSACAAEVLDPLARRYRYPFTNCTHCGPRFSIALALPWDRARTSMTAFDMCDACRAEYLDPLDRRYHAEPIACHVCGPRAQLARCDGRPFAVDTMSMLDAVDAVTSLLQRGAIVALKGLGGFQLLADATQPEVVERLRSRKRRAHKPFALMARDLALVSAYCEVSAEERAALLGPAAPIVLLRAHAAGQQLPLAEAVYPLPPMAARRYGFMLPATPLHALALRRMARPVVCTSGNRSEEPQVIEDSQAFAQLGDIADWILGHDRPIHNRVDDSVVHVFAGRTRVLRRARGLAPAPLPLPPGFESIAARESVWAAGSDLKAAICLSRAADLVLSQHLGDLDDARSFEEYRVQGARLGMLFEHRPTRMVADNHPDSRAAQHARALASDAGLPFHTVSHHHAHFAACLGDNGVALDSAALLGLSLDGVGVGPDARSLWGCELLLGGYHGAERVASLRGTALLGGDRAAREPWRCLYAQLRAALDWPALERDFAGLPVVQRLRAKPTQLLEQLLERGIAAPQASSCGRLFDAVAAALELCFEQQSFEAQAAQLLEALVSPELLAWAVAEHTVGDGYALPIYTDAAGLPTLDPRPLWPALLADLRTGAVPGLIAARFHVALAAGLAQLCACAAVRTGKHALRQVALSGGCLQNAVLHERLQAELAERGFSALSHAAVPAHDGGIALGQALVTLAQTARAAETER